MLQNVLTYRLLSVKSGNPITIQDEDIGTGWPIHDVSPYPTGKMCYADCQDASIPAPWPSVVLTHYTKLSRILGRIGEGVSSLARVTNVCSQLTQTRNLPQKTTLSNKPPHISPKHHKLPLLMARPSP